MRWALTLLAVLTVMWAAQQKRELRKVTLSPGRYVQSDVMGRATADVVVRVSATAREGDGIGVILDGPVSQSSVRPWKDRTEEFRYPRLPAGTYAIVAALVDPNENVLDSRVVGQVTVVGDDRN